MGSPVESSAKPSERFIQIAREVDRRIKMAGITLLGPKLEFHHTTFWPTLFAIVNYALFGVFSMIQEARQDWKESLKSSIMIGGLVHGSVKLFIWVQRQPSMRNVTFYTRDIYVEYEQKGPKYVTLLNSNIDRYLGIRRYIRNGYFTTFGILITMPLVYLVYNGSRFTIIHYDIPGLDVDKNWGFVLTYIIQLVTICAAGLGFYAGELFSLMGMTQIFTFSDILRLKINELNAALEKKAERRSNCAVGMQIDHPGDVVDELLLDIIRWHQMITDFTMFVNALYYEVVAAQVLSSAVSITVSFCVMLTDFHGIYAVYLLVGAYSMVIYCAVGTKIEYAFDQLYFDVNDIAWYDLTPKQRRMFSLMLKESQNPHLINLLGVMPLSVRTALQITKLIYSLSMMMQNTT